MLKTNRERCFLLLTAIMYVTNAIFSILTTDRNAKVIECAERAEVDKLWYMIILSVAVVIIEKITAVCMTIMNQKYVSESELWTKREIIHGILQKPINLFRKKDEAYYINLMTTDTSMYREGCLGSYPWLCYFVAYGLFSFFMLARINLILSLVILALSVMPLLSEKMLAPYVEAKKNSCSTEAKAYMQVLKEIAEGYESIRLDDSSAPFEKRFNEAAIKCRKAGATQIIANSISQETLYTTASILQLVALGVGSYMSAGGKFSAAMLFAAISYAVALSNSFSNISYYFISIKSTKAISERLKEEMKTGEDAMCKNPRQSIGEETDNDSISGFSLSYKNFSYGYENRILYKSFSADFKAGGCYAIVGESGAGKSTLVNALLKYYDDYMGEIYFNGENIRDLSDSEIYKKIAVVDQVRWLFNASVHDNITMLSREPAKESDEYRKLLRMLKLEELEDKAEDRSLGDFGDYVSGGEKQRICIARALRRKIGLLILDEPTSGLDPENANIVNDFIFGLSGVTRIVITHDWSQEYLSKFDSVIQIGSSAN